MAEQRILDLVQELDEELREDIIDRYHNREYWDPSIIDEFFQNNKVSYGDKKEILSILG